MTGYVDGHAEAVRPSAIGFQSAAAKEACPSSLKDVIASGPGRASFLGSIIFNIERPMISNSLRQIVGCLVLLTGWLGAGAAAAQSITNPIAALKNHITGVAPLTAAQIVTQGNSIQTNIRQVGTNDIALAAALDLVASYDSTIGALFTSGSPTYGGFTRDGAGDELAQALFDLQQGIIDHTYNNKSANLTTYYSLLNNTKFGTSSYFPGAVAPPASTNQGYAVSINATHAQTWGMPNLYVNEQARRPTGCYLAPGSIAEVTVPAAYANKGWFIRVGCHYWDFKAKSNLKRLDRVSLIYQITSPKTRIANPLGGNIYIGIPYQQTNGIVTVGITNVVRSPLFRNTVAQQTTAAEWLTERTQPGAWADFESEKFMMQVPRKWIYNYANAVTVMEDWDKAMDAVSDLLGRPRLQSKTVLYIQPDVLIRGTANAPGYPQVNQDEIYNPNTAETGNKNHYLLTGPQDANWVTFHEMGHGQYFAKFSGETEAAVNLPHVAVKNIAFGVPLESAFSESVANSTSMNLRHAALSWILPANFRANKSMTFDEMKYQHRGHGKYVEVANLFGWQTLSNFWYDINVDYENGANINVNADPTDGRILRMSKVAGVDMTPLFHLWGMKPVNAATLKANIAAAGLKPSSLIFDRLKFYQSVVPLTLAQFRTHYWIAKGVVGEPDKSWYVDMFDNYTPDIGYASIAQLQFIIDLYFPLGTPPDIRWTGATSALWNTSASNWQTISTATATNYTNGNVVLFDDLAANPAITLNVNVTPGGMVFSNHTTAYSIAGTGQIGGPGPLTKLGAGGVTLAGIHTFSGDIDVQAGAFIATTGGACANSDLRVLAGATNRIQVLAANGQWTCGSLNSYSGSYLDFDFGSVTPSPTTAPLLVNGNLTLTGAKIMVRSAAGLGLGQYALIKYTNTLSGTVPVTAFAVPALPPGASGVLVNNTANKSIDLLITVVATLNWAAGNGNWDLTTPNWSSNGVPGFTYSNGKDVVFDDSASGGGPVLVTNALSVSPASMTANLTNKNYTISGSSISGSTAVIKEGPGSLTLSGNNSYTGGTAVRDGVLKVGLANALGGGAITVEDGATLDLNGFGLTGKPNYVIHIAGAGVVGQGALVDDAGTQLNLALTNLVLDADASVGGTKRFDIRPVNGTPLVDLAGHTLTKVGINQFWLQEANVTLGNFVVQEGVLGLNTISVTNGSIRVNAGAELRLFRAVTTAPCVLTRPITLEGGALLAYTGRETADAIDQVVLSAITLEGDATVVAGNSLADSFNSVFELAGPISGPGGLIKSGTNTVLLSGDNTYSGNTTISAGTLRVGSTNGLPRDLDLDEEDVPETGNVAVAGTLDLNAFSVQLNGLSGAGTLDTLSGGTPVLTVGKNDQTSAFSGAIKNSAGSLQLIKIGTGILTLSGANTYSGGTIVSAGELLVSNASGSGTGSGYVTVNSDATLGGNGSINGPVTIQFGGTLAPGASVGRLTIASNLVMQGTALMEIARNGAVLTNDLVTGIKTNTYGGILMVTNVGGSPLQVGDSFQLFSANSYADSFETILYPEGYTFTNSLAVNGRIGVAAVNPAAAPNFSASGVVKMPDGNFSLTATGSVGSPYQLWASTDVALSPILSTWTLLTNGTVPVSPFTIIDTTATNFPQRFYLFSTP
jgi:autotransporter-associated beta strand protein